jgi:hypothetical protein
MHTEEQFKRTREGTVRASMATIPSRSASLERAVASLLPQVDVLQVYCNGHRAVPRCLVHPRISAIGTPTGLPDIGASAKFVLCGEADGYRLTCDDDLEYPSDYVATMLDAVDRYDRKAVVGVHGAVLAKRLGRTYQACRQEVLHFFHGLKDDRAVHLLGTGCLAYHGELVRPSEDVFIDAPNMVDVWFACFCQRKGIPRVAIARPDRWIRQLPFDGNLWDRNKGSLAPAEALRSVDDWSLLEPPP